MRQTNTRGVVKATVREQTHSLIYEAQMDVAKPGSEGRVVLADLVAARGSRYKHAKARDDLVRRRASLSSGSTASALFGSCSARLSPRATASISVLRPRCSDRSRSSALSAHPQLPGAKTQAPVFVVSRKKSRVKQPSNLMSTYHHASIPASTLDHFP